MSELPSQAFSRLYRYYTLYIYIACPIHTDKHEKNESMQYNNSILTVIILDQNIRHIVWIFHSIEAGPNSLVKFKISHYQLIIFINIIIKYDKIAAWGCCTRWKHKARIHVHHIRFIPTKTCMWGTKVSSITTYYIDYSYVSIQQLQTNQKLLLWYLLGIILYPQIGLLSMISINQSIIHSFVSNAEGRWR